MKTSMSDQTSPDSINRDRGVNPAALGGWLFRHRTWLPLPVAAAILVLRAGEAPRSLALLAGGVVITVLGEALRFWGVHHIGVISRTRSDRLGPLIATGPFGIVRNPLYVGNIALWVGFALTARLVWLAPVIAVLLGLEYHAIVRWEEQLLESRLGEAYRNYARRVNRWIPTFNREARSDEDSLRMSPTASAAVAANRPYSWQETFFSERGTLIAMAVGYLLLWLKTKL